MACGRCNGAASIAPRYCSTSFASSLASSFRPSARAASAAHTYGKPIVHAEAFTSGELFTSTPWSLKRRGDWALTEGINHWVLHVYIHQPWEDKVPGVNAWFGTEFNRHNTWFEQSKAWVDYLRRSCWLLQQGNRVADVAYFIGEDAPKMTGVRQPELPPGRDFDYINAEVILYADNITPSMQRAMDETNRRRKLQLAYNAEHGITPESVRKEIRNSLERIVSAYKAAADAVEMSEQEMDRTELVTMLEKEMFEAAEALEFEKAAKLRDRIQIIKSTIPTEA